MSGRVIRKVIVIVMDGAGIGELPDAAKYGDKGSNTIGNIISKRGYLKIDNLIKLGLGNINDVLIPYKSANPSGCFAKASEASPGKDTITGHWEIAGIIMDKPFPVYPEGFPDEVIEPFKEAINRDILGNMPASGTEIIKKMGKQHMDTGFPIVYTSADSVFQIAAHQQVIPLDELYDMCQKARNILKGKHSVGRVIARPFAGEIGSFFRTENRRDFSLKPVGTTMLDIICKNGYEVAAVGKIKDIFANEGITKSILTHSNSEGVEATLELIKQDFSGLIFTNLIDFDMLYGHRNDLEGYARSLEEFDRQIPLIIGALSPQDILILTADHGCDPTTSSTDHSREYIPIIVYGQQLKAGVNLGIRESFSDIGATVLDFFGIKNPLEGTSFKDKIIL